MIKILFLLFNLFFVNSFNLIQHPLEKRIGYIYGIKNIKNLDNNIMIKLQETFKTHPLLIFKDLDSISPIEFIDFVKCFDKDYDSEALSKPDDNIEQMLQPFDQFPDCKHVAPRGNVELLNFHNIKNLNITPHEPFINNYLWHTDILGHETKLPNVVTGFYIIEQPLIGGDTDFISGETIYENLNLQEQLASINMLIEVNRKKFISNKIQIDYAGVNRLESYEQTNDGNTQIPLVYAPNDDNYEKPRILIMPTFFEKVVGWSVEDSRNWIRNFMNEKVLPHRVTIQWKKNDLAVFNNRRFMHSSTPARNYLDNKDSSKRLLLQTFIPTKKPLLGIKPTHTKVCACYNLKWVNNQEVAIKATQDNIKFAINKALMNNEPINHNQYYVIKKKKI